MDLLRFFLPWARVQVFGLVVWLLARWGLPAEHAGAVTDFTMAGIVFVVTQAYGFYASWREPPRPAP